MSGYIVNIKDAGEEQQKQCRHCHLLTKHRSKSLQNPKWSLSYISNFARVLRGLPLLI